MKNVRTAIVLTERELATVLAALRHWQRDWTQTEVGDPPLFDHFDNENTPLTNDEIDAFCERINYEAAEN